MIEKRWLITGLGWKGCCTTIFFSFKRRSCLVNWNRVNDFVVCTLMTIWKCFSCVVGFVVRDCHIQRNESQFCRNLSTWLEQVYFWASVFFVTRFERCSNESRAAGGTLHVSVAVALYLVSFRGTEQIRGMSEPFGTIFEIFFYLQWL